MDNGIGRWATRRAQLDGDSVAFVCGDKRWTYGEFETRTNRLAHALVEQLGVRRGDRVAVLMVNSVELLETLFACAKIGAIFSPINFRLSASEIGYILTDLGADVLVLHEQFAAGRVALEEPGVRVRHVVEVGAAYEELLACGAPTRLDMDVDPRDIAMIMYTSGTTGQPKGAMLTHANTIANAQNVASTVGRGLRKTDVTVTVTPMFHIGGLGMHTLPFFYLGARNVIVPAFDPVGTLELMARERATVQLMVPAMWAALMRVPNLASYDLSALDLALSSGAPTPLPVIDFYSELGVPFQEGFGMTEAAPGIAFLDAEYVKTKAGSVGRALFAIDTRIVDPNGAEVPTGKVGELVVRGANVAAGYWMRPEATAEAFRDGWFHTGDLGRVDDEGFITLVDRKKDMIITGGENVYPIEVEQVLCRYPGIVEVATIGVPDDKWGETVVAYAVVQEGAEVTAEALVSYARERLAHFKCPTRVEFIAELPRTATGKIRKTELRQRETGQACAVTR